MSKLPISQQELDHFYEQFKRSGQAARGIRFGQAWINQYLPANLSDPVIFFEPDMNTAYHLILSRYVVVIDQFT